MPGHRKQTTSQTTKRTTATAPKAATVKATAGKSITVKGKATRVKAASQQPIVPWLITGTVEAERRGVDTNSENNRKTVNQYVETLVERDPLLFRARAYYDLLPIGTGIKVSSKYPAIDGVAKRWWVTAVMDERQSRVSIDLFATGNAVARVPIGKDVNELPTVELIPVSQIEKIITDANGTPTHYMRVWRVVVYGTEAIPDGPVEGRKVVTATEKVMTEYIPAAEIVHTAINVGSKDLRGISPLQVAAKWATVYSRSLEGIHLKSLVNGFLAFHAKVLGVDESDEQVQSLRDMFDDTLIDRTDLNGVAYRTIPQGQVLTTSENVTMEALGPGNQAGSMDAELRRLMLMTAVACGIPEFAFSDGNYANLASSESQANPFFRQMQSHQRAVVRHIRGIYKLVFDRFVTVNKMFADGTILNELKAEGMGHLSDAVMIAAPDILTPSVEKLGPVVAELVAAEIVSREHANQMLGNDWSTMSEQIQKEKAAGFVSAPAAPPAGTIAFAADRAATESPVDAKRAVMRKITREYFEAVKGSGGDAAKMKAAHTKWLADMKAAMGELIDTAKAVGVESINGKKG